MSRGRSGVLSSGGGGGEAAGRVAAASEHRTAFIGFRLQEAEKARLEARAAECGQTLSNYVRAVALGAVPVARPHAGERELARQLARVGNNLNQLARRLNAGDAPAPTEVLETLQSVDRRLRSVANTLAAASP